MEPNDTSAAVSRLLLSQSTCTLERFVRDTWDLNQSSRRKQGFQRIPQHSAPSLTSLPFVRDIVGHPAFCKYTF